MSTLISALIQIVTPCGLGSLLLTIFLIAALFVVYRLYKQLVQEQERFYNARDLQEAALRDNINRLASIISKQRDIIAKLSEDLSLAACPFRLSPRNRRREDNELEDQ